MEALRKHLRNVLKKELANIHRRKGSAFIGEALRRRSRKHSRKGSALIGLPYRAVGSGRKRKSTGKPRGNSSALNEINKLVKEYRRNGYEFRDAQKMASKDYRAKKGGRRASHKRSHKRSIHAGAMVAEGKRRRSKKLSRKVSYRG
jgi:hypothetical protein